MTAPKDGAVRVGRLLFRNRRTGGITVVQWPNFSLGAYIVATLIVRLGHPKGTVNHVIHDLGTAALIIWALDEIVRGVNPFRRLLGTVVLAATVAALLL